MRTCSVLIDYQLFKLARHGPGMSQEEIDRDSVLMRAYGNNTDILIDRDREATSHLTCAEHDLAPPLLARFKNGLLYRYIPGDVCTPQDLIDENVWRPVARRLGKWHATLPISVVSAVNGNGAPSTNGRPRDLSERKPGPNIWTVIHKWIEALPQETAKQQARKAFLLEELAHSFHELDNTDGPGHQGFVFGHCDLLSANVIKTGFEQGQQSVAFIDYEYAVTCPAAFDIANHFAEWGGYDCDYNMLPSKSIRHEFLTEYLSSYKAHSTDPGAQSASLDFLEAEVDRFRGMPGFYWGVWALIQAQISLIDFDYASYAEVRLGEYTAWRDAASGRGKENEKAPLREKRWAEE